MLVGETRVFSTVADVADVCYAIEKVLALNGHSTSPGRFFYSGQYLVHSQSCYLGQASHIEELS